MELVQILGNTWCLDAQELIPLYRLDAKRCILLDSGLESERAALTEALDANGLVPVGVLSSHAHRDHSANNFYLRERYGTRVCLSQGEAAMCSSLLMFKAAYDTFSPDYMARVYAGMIGQVDEAIGPDDGEYVFCGVPFQIIHTPGHTPDHICAVTPDGVGYAGDAVMAGAVLAGMRLPYHYAYARAFESMDKLKACPPAPWVVAHRAVEPDIAAVAAANQAALARYMEGFAALIRYPMTQDQVCAALCREKKLLTSHEDKAGRYARSVRTILEYLTDIGRVSLTVRDGMRYYQRT